MVASSIMQRLLSTCISMSSASSGIETEKDALSSLPIQSQSAAISTVSNVDHAALSISARKLNQVSASDMVER